jgi:prophage antirepressor-like protein
MTTKIITNAEYGNLRIAIDDNGKLMFKATDILTMLQYAKVYDLTKSCPSATKIKTPVHGHLKVGIIYISLSDVIELANSRDKNGTNFLKWICNEVITEAYNG